MSVKLAYSLCSKTTSLSTDNVTPIRAVFAVIRVDKNEKEMLASVRRVLLNAGIPSFDGPPDDGVNIWLDDIERSRCVLEAQGCEIVSMVPQSALAHVRRPETRIPDQDIRHGVGPLWDSLKEFQKVAVTMAVHRRKVFIGDAMGAGKTLEAIATCRYFKSHWPVLIVCPAILKNTWKNELEKWLGNEVRVRLISGTKKHKDNRDYDFLVTSYAVTHRPLLHETLSGHKVVILDESHYIKNSESKRGNAALVFAQKAEIRLVMSGTPFSYPSEMYPQIQALYPEIFPDFNGLKHPPERKRPWGRIGPSALVKEISATTQRARHGLQTYVERYCDPKYSDAHAGWTFKGYTNQEELHAVLGTFAIRRRKEDLLPFLPAKRRSCVVLHPLAPDEQSQVDKVLKDEIKDNAFMEAFRKTCEFKIPHVVKYLRSEILPLFRNAEGPCALVFVHHTAMRTAVEALFKAEKVPYFSIFGGVSDSKRAAFERDFQKGGKYRAGVLSMQAACAGLTLTEASIVLFTELLFSPDIMFQAEDRVHRIGQTKDVDVTYLISPKSTDDINWGLIKKKEQEAGFILDGERHFIESTRTNFSTVRPRVISKRMRTKLDKK